MQTDISRQFPLALTYPISATVVGCGGVGAWVAILLAMSGIRTLNLMDSDVLEESNLNRLPFTRADIGREKVDVLRDYIDHIRPEATVIPLPNADANTLELAIAEVLFDCTDRYKIQLMIQAWCREHGVKYIRAGYDGTHGTVTGNVAEFSVGDVDGGGYEVTPSWSVPAIIVAALAVAKCMYYPKLEMACDIVDAFREPTVITRDLIDIKDAIWGDIYRAKWGFEYPERYSAKALNAKCSRCGQGMAVHKNHIYCKDQPEYGYKEK